MGELIFTVADAFTVEGRGVVATVAAWGGGAARVGDAIELRRPDGSTLHATVRGITHPRKELLLSGELRRTDIPAGTQIWTVDNSHV
jgi:hypothetical protein